MNPHTQIRNKYQVNICTAAGIECFFRLSKALARHTTEIITRQIKLFPTHNLIIENQLSRTMFHSEDKALRCSRRLCKAHKQLAHSGQ